MEKKINEEEFLELEQEIDSAVDRLFREKVDFQEGVRDTSFLEPTALAEPQAPSGPLEGLEAQLLQLEWEVTAENLQKSEQEIKALRRTFRENPRILSVLGLMEGVLRRMIEKGEGIEPPFMKFLLDAKEALKFLLKPVEGPSAPYQQLLYEGLEARASLLLSSVAAPTRDVAPSLERRPDEEGGSQLWKRLDGLAEGLRTISEKMEDVLSRVEKLLLRLEGTKSRGEPVRTTTEERQTLQVTVFRAHGKLYGVVNEKVYKVFRVPEELWTRYGGAQKVRLKDLEVRLIDLGKFLSREERESPRGERILLVEEDGGYIGFRIDEVLKRLSGPLFQKGEPSEPFVIGHIRWRFENRPVDVPILDPKRFS